MTKRVTVISVMIFIFCILLAIFAIVLGILMGSSGPRRAVTTLTDLPNVMGDEGAYVAQSFFIENNLQIPFEIVAVGWGNGTTSIYMAGREIRKMMFGRGKDLYYTIETKNIGESNFASDIKISCYTKLENIGKLNDTKTYDGYTYQEQIITEEKTQKVEYQIDIKSGKTHCRMFLSIKPTNQENMEDDLYMAYCEELLHSLVDNIVYRNV